MSSKTYFLPIDLLKSFMIDTFTGIGVPVGDAKICADVLIASDLRGIESHGIGRLKMYYDRIKTGIQQPVTNFEVVRESPTTALVDGHHGMGHVIAHRAMMIAIEKAKKYGMGSVSVRNSTHFGIAGYYPIMAAREGLMGLTVTNARPSIAPTFGVQPMLGTNPIAFACPTDEGSPFVFDAATSITQRGKIEVLDREEKSTPAGWVIDQQGDFATDSKAILKGLNMDANALLPLGGAGEEFAGFKGYGLATIVEILSASLQNGAFLHDLLGFDEQGNRRPFMLGHFFMAIDVSTFVEMDEFKHTTGEILRQLRNSTRQPGKDRIYTAGEKEFENTKRITSEGVPVIPNLQRDIKIIQQELGLTQYNFPF